MYLIVKPLSSLCSLQEFSINGIAADTEDFEDVDALSPESAPDYGCSNRSFVAKSATEEVLSKYNITSKD